jgi:hypothetical protein
VKRGKCEVAVIQANHIWAVIDRPQGDGLVDGFTDALGNQLCVAIEEAKPLRQEVNVFVQHGLEISVEPFLGRAAPVDTVVLANGSAKQ